MALVVQIKGLHASLQREVNIGDMGMPAYTCVSVIETYLQMGRVARLTDAFHRYLQLPSLVGPSRPAAQVQLHLSR